MSRFSQVRVLKIMFEISMFLAKLEIIIICSGLQKFNLVICSTSDRPIQPVPPEITIKSFVLNVVNLRCLRQIKIVLLGLSNG